MKDMTIEVNEARRALYDLMNIRATPLKTSRLFRMGPYSSLPNKFITV